MRRCLLALCAIAIACGRSTPAPTPPPPPVSVPAVDSLPQTLEEVRALRAAGQVDRYERAMRLLVLSPDPKTRGRAEALLGIFYLDQNRPDDARPFLERAAADDPPVAPWIWLRIGTADALERLIATAASSSAATTARLRLAAIQPATYDATNPVRIDELTEEEFVQLARELAKNGYDDLALTTRMRLLTEYPQGRFTEETYGIVSRAASCPLDRLSLEDTVSLARRLGNAEHYDEALDLLRRFALRAPSDAASREYRDVRVRSLFHSRHYTELLTEFDEASLRDSALLLMRSRAAWRANRPQEFLAGLKRLEREYPRSAEVNDAKLLRAKYYTTDEPKLDVAIANLEPVIANGDYGTDGENLWTLGWTYFLANRYDDALRTFADYKRRFPDGDYLTNALFWSAKIHDRLGRTADRDAAFDELETSYPYNYFSYRARELRGKPPVAPSEVVNGNIFPNLDADMARVSDPRIDSVRELAYLALYRDASREMKSIAGAYPDNAGLAFMLADLYVEGGEPLHATSLLQRRFRTFIRHGGTGIPHRLWEILYPLAYWDVIEAEGARQRVDPYLIASIIRSESGFEPTTVSNAGAVGIMQIMPQEAPRIASAAGIEPPTRQQLFDPRINIAIGAAEYSQKRSAMNGNDILAIAAYNAGEDAVGKWIAATPGNDGDLFVESIPYNETRLYVKTVTRNRFEYRRIYENGRSPS